MPSEAVWRPSWGLNPGLTIVGISALSSSPRMQGTPWSGLTPRALVPCRQVSSSSVSSTCLLPPEAGAAMCVRKTSSSLPTSRVEF